MDERQETRVAAGTRTAIDLRRFARNVTDGEQRVLAQQKLIERLRLNGKRTDGAETVLHEMQDLLKTMRGLLADLRKFVELGLLPDTGAAGLEGEDDGRSR
jgi:hypothetical protein